MSKRSDLIFANSQLATKLCYECEKNKVCRLNPKSECEILYDKVGSALKEKAKLNAAG